MANDLKTYEYKILYFNETKEKEEIRVGLVPATSVVDAIYRIASYYGEDEIFEILFLREITDSEVFDVMDNVENVSVFCYLKGGIKNDIS